MTSIVVKVGSSSVTTPQGHVDGALIAGLCDDIAHVVAEGHALVVVSSGAIAVGWATLGKGGPRPGDPAVLQAVSTVGQHRLMRAWQDGLGAHGLIAGQVLLAPLDFVHRRQYLHARGTLRHLAGLGVIGIVNENDAVADEEIRFGDNDRLAALVAHLVGADLLMLLTDTPGLLDGDPRVVEEPSLIEEVTEIDHELEQLAGGPGTVVGSGGMASKLAAAKIATRSGVRTVIADASRPGVLRAVVASEPGAGTVFHARPERLGARKLWIAFALRARGRIVVDDGARKALVEDNRSLLPAGVIEIAGTFEPDDAVELVDAAGGVFAKGLVRQSSSQAEAWVGRRTSELGDDLSHEVVHRDDLVVLF
jgi:glutamate 5-kinase